MKWCIVSIRTQTNDFTCGCLGTNKHTFTVWCFRGIRLPNFATTNLTQTQQGRARRKQSHLFPMKSNLRFSHNSHCTSRTIHKGFIYSQSPWGDLLMPIKAVNGSDSYQTRERTPAGCLALTGEMCRNDHICCMNIMLNMQKSCETEDSCWRWMWECWRIYLFSILYFRFRWTRHWQASMVFIVLKRKLMYLYDSMLITSTVCLNVEKWEMCWILDFFVVQKW